MPKVSGATVVYGASPGSTGREPPFSTSKISGRLPRAEANSNAAPAASTSLAKGHRCPTENRYGTRAPAKDQRSIPSERSLRGTRRTGLAAAATVPKSVAGRDMSGSRPNWAAISASPGKPTSRSPSGQERSDPSRYRSPLRQRAAASLRHRIVGGRLRASPVRGANEAQKRLIVGRAIKVVPKPVSNRKSPWPSGRTLRR